MKHTVVVSIQTGALVKPCMQQLVELSSFLYSPFVKPNLLVLVKPKYGCLLYQALIWTFKILQKCNQYFEGKSRKNKFFFLNFIASLTYSCNEVSVIISVTILNVFVLLVAIQKVVWPLLVFSFHYILLMTLFLSSYLVKVSSTWMRSRNKF